MDVPVNDQDAFQSVLGARMFGRDRDVVEQAESHCPRRERVVTGRAHQAQTSIGGVCEHVVNCCAGGSCGGDGDHFRIRADDRIGIEPSATLLGETADQFPVLRGVDATEFVRSRFADLAGGRFVLQR